MTVVPADDQGRMLADRRSRLFRFLPQPGVRPASLVVRLTRGIQDLAGNPLRLAGSGEWILELPPVPQPPTADDGGEFGEIAEDFTSDRMMDPAGTCALWNDPAHPGVLHGSPARTTLHLAGVRLVFRPLKQPLGALHERSKTIVPLPADMGPAAVTHVPGQMCHPCTRVIPY